MDEEEALVLIAAPGTDAPARPLVINLRDEPWLGQCERVLEVVPAAVARAAVDSGVARNPYPAHYPLKSMDDII